MHAGCQINRFELRFDGFLGDVAGFGDFCRGEAGNHIMTDLGLSVGQRKEVSHLIARDRSEHEAVLFANRKSGARPFLIEIAPLRDSVGEIERGLAGSLIFIVDPNNQGAICTKRLSILCGLTETEGEICNLMVGGRSASEIASERGVSEETVKSQFKAVYVKTGVRRRADLVRLALTVDPPIG